MFSNLIKLENLNDYNNEAEKCIKPFLYKNSSIDDEENDNFIQVERPNLINIKKIKKKNYNRKERGEISLTDCLACSGCVTNEETTFLKSQNCIEIINTVKKKKINIISLSLQSVTALSVYYKLPISTIQKKLCFFFKSLNFHYVYDSSLGELITLNEAKKEFLEYFFKNNETYENNNIYPCDDHVENVNHQKEKNILIRSIFNDKKKKKKNPSYNDNNNNDNDNDYDNNNNDNDYDNNNNDKHYRNNSYDKYVSSYSNNSSNKFSLQYKDKKIGQKTFPLICSHCSGTVIYGEKNFEDDLLNSFSKIKSSQDIQGIILKILHLHNSVLYTYPSLNKYIYNNFFRLYNYKFNWINICRKHFLKNYRFNDSASKKKNNNNFDNDNNMGVFKEMEALNIYDINHVYLLYCFDKKLEACRIHQEQQTSIENNMKNYLSGQNVDYNIYIKKEQDQNKFYCVDAVMTTVELIELINNMNIDFYTLPELYVDNIYKLIKRISQDDIRGVHNIVSALSDVLNENVSSTTKVEHIKNNNDDDNNNNNNNNIRTAQEYKDKSIATGNMNEQKKKNNIMLNHTEVNYMKYIYDDLFLHYLIRCSHKNNISMGYGEEIFKYVCKEIFNFPVDENSFNLKYEDIIVLSLFKNNNCVFRVILSYGFKSMHNVLRKIKELKNEHTKNYKNVDEQVSHYDENKNTYDINITYNLLFNGRIDYVELMACEKGCLFGCAQNIFSEPVEKFSYCSCNNFDIFKKLDKQEIISNFDFLQVSNDKNKKETNKFCCNENHKNYVMNSLYNNNNNNNNDQDENLLISEYKDKEKLFKKLFNTMHDDQYTLYVNSKNCIYDHTINSFLKNIFHVFNNANFHLFKATFSSKKKLDITNW
ncbi:cytosolic Fe-S cluster assembly factor NAR1, putative [Plasmodium reichenowi]|uniref:Cytosolic Fe-S cluster assembly factor NAR1, putative n=1 Tax=Plasmodium reichenowi TaxID=5854 RepID=A0A2P9D8W4_PLARE|nr:cytosolic Fe-S cluster assembly factor NAR1, putative [Plasmodium reichenowi]